MTALFPEDERKVRRPRKKRQPEPPKKIVEQTDYVILPDPVLGRADDLFDCGFCGGRCHEVVDEYKGKWKIECCFCGLKEPVRRIDGVLPEQPASADFVIKSGRFADMTLRELSITDSGKKAIAWMAKKHDSKEVREACRAWVDSLAKPK